VAAYGFEEASGATAVDALGHRNGTIVGGATRTGSGRFGQALTLDGASGMVTVPDDSTLRLSSGMTLEAWVRPSALTSASSILTKDQTGGFSYSLLANTAANVPSANVFTTSALAAAGPASLALGTWTHVAETWDGANVKLFIDGAEVASQPTTGSLAVNAGQLKIGGSSAAGQFFNGLVDEVRVFSRARTASEIGADMNTPVSP
jgi:Concanavalin A-like lectin/glucanases superfamily